MSHNSNKYLKLCQELKHQGIEFAVEPGVRLARGYADLGFEEYYLGTVSEYRSEQAGFFFVVPETAELINQALQQNFKPEELKFTDNLNWQYLGHSNNNLNELLINFLLADTKVLQAE